MPYPIILSDSVTTLISIPDNSLVGPLEPQPSNCSLNLVGRGAVNYGLPMATNFAWLLENFANVNPPVSPLPGQLWYNTSQNAVCLQLYNINGNWDTVATSSASFNTTQNVTISGASYGLRLYDSTQPIDQKYVDFIQSNSVFQLRLVNDTYTASNNVVSVSRNGYQANVVRMSGARIILAGNVAMPYGATAVTTAFTDNTVNVATTAFVQGAASAYLPLSGGTISGALIANTITAATPGAGDNSSNVATTAFVVDYGLDYLPLSGGTLTGTLVANVITAVTPAIGDNSTNVATTAFVIQEVGNTANSFDIPVASTVLPLVDGTASIGTSSAYTRADHVHPTDTSRTPYTDFYLSVPSVDEYLFKIPTQYGSGGLSVWQQAYNFSLNITASGTTQTATFALPYAFPTAIITCFCCFDGTSPPNRGNISCSPGSSTQVTITGCNLIAAVYGVRVIAYGY